MERWRSFFGSSGEDLWTVIDRALTIAATDYPQELRVRRDGFAEKLFTPYLHSHTSTFGEGQSLAGPNVRDTKFLATNFHPLTSSIGEAPAFTGSDGRTGSPPLSEREQGREHERTNIARDSYNYEFNVPAIGSLPNNEELIANMEESRQIQDILTIKEQILNPDQTEAACLAALQTLEDMRISVPILKATVIGKPVNALRKQSSRQVRTAVKRLISLWKDVVDEWVAKEGEDAACAYLGST
ncbi:hypothetical protein O6H91_06G044400 [Diphasiastrum complanatum]|uniref:Uncharacterized protein n=1 Tax=Diphasiastrum complanatum TaxID=34168 RepID=A0ACC2DDF0_DIPCM|nr:hypothetical protein O6H91_06G044400 [Diphasiastrum complanatum]